MKKLINQPFLHTCVLILALLMAQGACGQNLVFMHQADSGGPDGTEVTAKSINWTERGNISWPKAFALTPVSASPIFVSDVNYSSSDASVATVNAASGEVTVLAYSGTVTISATYTGDDTSYEDASYTLTIEDDRGTIADLSVAFSTSTVSATYGDATVSTPTLDMGQLAGAAMTWSSSATNVATVNASGDVTIVGAGEAVISASYAGDDAVKPGSVSYNLAVEQKEVGLTWGETGFTYDGSAHVPTATATGLVGSDACTVTVDGVQTNAGSYTATASALSNANYKLPNANTTAFTIAKAASALTKAPTGNSLSYSGSPQSLVTAGTASGGTLQYSLDNSTFTEAIPTGTNADSYTVYYRVVGDANHEDSDGGQVIVTIAKADATVTFSSKSVGGKMGETFTAPTVTTSPAGLALNYVSSDTNVATVDASTGAVMLVAQGSTTITATFAGDTNYNSASDSYALTVAKADAVEAELSFVSATATATYGDATVSAPALNNPQQLPLSWSSSNTAVATVDALTGAVTIAGVGETIITAAFAGDDDYMAKSASYTLVIAKADATVTFSSKSVGGKMGETFTAPTVTTSPAGLALNYVSSDTNVATVDASTGAVMLVAQGSTTITATFAGDTNYNSASDSYTLVVEQAEPDEPETADEPEEPDDPEDPNEPEEIVEPEDLTEQELVPIVKEVDYRMSDDDFIMANGHEVNLANKVVNHILYTLKDQSSPTGDGYDTNVHSIVINTVMSTAGVNAVLASGLQPGSLEYARQFTGMTFLVPAGEGFIVVNSQEAEDCYLMVKVGDNDPVAISMQSRGDYEIPYLSDQPTYVYLWNGGRNTGGTRGKKTVTDVRVRKISYKGVSANGIIDVKDGMTDDDIWYDLNGQRIMQPVKKGIYIHGHRKVVYP